MENLSWQKCVGICTDGAPAMLGVNSDFVAHVKRIVPSVITNHCMIHHEALASKTLPDELQSLLKSVIEVVNFIKSNALNTRLFVNICMEMDSCYQNLLFLHRSSLVVERKHAKAHLRYEG